MKTKQCKECGLIYLPVDWFLYKRKFCSEKCEDVSEEKWIRILAWRKRLDDAFVPGRG